MKIKSEKITFVILTLINVLIFNIVIKDYYGIINFSYKDLFFNILLILIVFSGIVLFKDGKDKKYKIFGIGIIILGVFLIYKAINTYSLDSIMSNINMINIEISEGNKLYYELFKELFTIISLVLTGVSLLTLYIFPFNLLIIDFILLVFLEVTEYKSQNVIYIFYFTYIIILSIIFYRSKVNLLDQKKKYNFSLQNNLQLIVLSIVILISFSFINLNKDGVYINSMKSYLSDTIGGNRYISSYDVDDQFTLNKTGYSDGEKKLGGNIDIDNKISLRVDSEAPLYLRGSVKYKYKGDSWEKYDLEVEDKESLNSNEIINFKEATIIPEYKFTSALFNTINTRDVNLEDASERILKDKSANLYFLEEKNENAYKIFYKSDGLKNMISSDIYRKKPINNKEYITDKVSDFAEKLVDDDMSREDKAIAITNYLKDNYTYSLEPGNLDSGKDFVEDFLFENKKGYCVHFATSLTVLLDSLGIEARYVEGFKMSDEMIDGKYIVRNSDAHAWTEVLIGDENNIWTIFDSTGTVRDYNEENGIPIIDSSENDSEDDNNMENDRDDDIKNEDYENSDAEETIKENEKEKSLFTPFNNKLQKELVFKDYTIITLFILLMFFTLNYIQRKMTLNSVLKSNNFDLKFSIFMIMLEPIYGEKNPTETFKEYKVNIKDKKIQKIYEDITTEYYIKNYSENEIKSETEKRDKTLYILLLEEYKNRINIFAYIYNKYIKVYGFTKYI